jgi:hypothetical protein
VTSSGAPCTFRRICFRMTQMPESIAPGSPGMAGACETMNSRPDIVRSRPSNASRVCMRWYMDALYVACVTSVALFEVTSKKGDCAK